jgi:hypothetical protein
MSEELARAIARLAEPQSDDHRAVTMAGAVHGLEDAFAAERAAIEAAAQARGLNDPGGQPPAAVDLCTSLADAAQKFSAVAKAIETHARGLRAKRASLAATLLPLIPKGRGGKIEGAAQVASRSRGKDTARVVDREKLPAKFWIHPPPPEPYPDQETLDTLAAKGVIAEGCERVPGQDTISIRKKDSK